MTLAAGGGSNSAAAKVAISSEQLFTWAQLTYPSLFPGTGVPFSDVPYLGKVFSGRGYANGNYLAVADGEAYGLGPFTDNVLQNFGSVQGFADLVCARVDCGGSSGGGSLNGCQPPASETLRTGMRFVGTYVMNLFSPIVSTTETTTVSVVDGPASFNGQSAIQITNTLLEDDGMTQSEGGIKSYYQAAENGLVRSLGAEIGGLLGGLTTRTVFDPPILNSEFTLQVGQSITKTESTTTTFVGGPIVIPPRSGTTTRTYTFEARETIDVLGRSFDTCRYKEVASGTDYVSYSWHIVGIGISARLETRQANGTVSQRTELKSATIDGAPV